LQLTQSLDRFRPLTGISSIAYFLRSTEGTPSTPARKAANSWNRASPILSRQMSAWSFFFVNLTTLALEMIIQTAASGLFPARWIGCDSFFGRNKEFLASLPEEYYYFADIPENIMVWQSMPTVYVPEYSGRGKKPEKLRASTQPIPVSQIARDKSIPWREVVLGEGAKGPIVAQVKCLRVIEATKESSHFIPYQEVWLYIRKYADGKVKYAFSNAPADIKRTKL